MNKILVLAEKPSVGRDIARVLGCSGKNKGYMEGSKYIVTWAMGHLVQLASPESYDKKYEVWSMDTLPMLPNPFKLETMSKTGHQYRQVKALLHRKDVTEIVIATDAGREGELVARWILEYSKCRKPVKRLWISSVTDQAIKNGFANLKPGKAYENLFHSAVARAQADWIVGLNASRALTCKHNASLSCGRVQTPTLGMVNARDELIRNFVPETLHGLTAIVDGMSYDLVNHSGQIIRMKSSDEIQKIIKQLEKGTLKVKSSTTKEKYKYPAGLHDLTSLQQEASQRYDFSAKETLRTMQGLYETHKILTYPRTDSKYLTKDIVATLKDRLRCIQIGPFKSHVTTILRQEIKGHKSFVDDNKVSDHHAIIPTEGLVDLSALSSKEYKIYDLVVKRFMAVLMKPAKYEQLTIELGQGNYRFVFKQEIMVDPGFEVLFDKASKVEKVEVPIAGRTLKPSSYKATKKLTQAPPRFTEGTLLGAMENPVKYMVDHDSKAEKTLKETGGLGTVATRADIIEKLFNYNFMEKKGKQIHITSSGKQLLKLVPEGLRTPDLTAQWELQLSKIAKGELKKDVFVNGLIDYTKSVINEIKESETVYKHANVSSQKCPDCGKSLLNKDNKYGKALVCSDRSCGYKKNISKATNARCPNCHKKLSLVGEGEGKRFVCKCGYKEKMSSFDEKRQKRKQQMGKRDIGKYLNKQKDVEENFNNPFKDLLGKLDE